MKRRYHYFIICIFLAFLIFVGFTYSIDFLQLLIKKNQKYSERFPIEKVYLHLDKNHYQVGDTLWFKAYIVSRASHYLSRRSAALHCMIIDASGNLVTEKSYVNINGNVQGDFVFNRNIPEGYYRIIAYTSWMKNFDIEGALIKEFQIKQFVPPTIKFRLGFNKPLYKPGDTIKVAIQTYSAKGFQRNFVGIKYQVSMGKKLIIKTKDKVSDQGLKYIQFPLPDTPIEPPCIFQIQPLEEDLNFNIFSLIPTEKIDLQFFPESGDLVEGVSSSLAFKAINQLGEPFDFEGEIIDSTGLLVCKIKSSYEGMGNIDFIPKANKSYTARIIHPEGIQTIYRLPPVLKTGYVISISDSGQDTVKGFIRSSARQVENITMTVMIRGQIYLAAKGILKGESILNFPVQKMPMGVAVITLFNSINQPVAERLVYINKHKQLLIKVTSDKSVYKPREKVKITIKATDYQGKPASAVLSLAVVDSSLSFNSKIQTSNIISYLTLESEIKGKIINPSYYFNDSCAKSDKALDLVLQTQGWRRFEWFKDLLQDIYNMPQPQNFDAITGTVYKRFRNKTAPNTEVNLIQINTKDVFTTKSDEKGRFCYIPEYLDSKVGSFFITANSSKTLFGVKVVMDSVKENFFKNNLLDFCRQQSKSMLSKDYMTFTPGQFKRLDDSPLKNDNYILLPEVMIKGLKKYDETGKWLSRFENAGAKVLRSEDLFPSVDLFELIRSVYPVYYDRINNKLYFDGMINYKQGIMFEVDGNNYRSEYDFVSYIRGNEVDAIAILKGDDAVQLYGSNAKDGAVIIKTKQFYYDSRKSSDIVVGRAFSSLRNFYSPLYDPQFQIYSFLPEGRITLYWQPLIFIDKNGETTIEFYNSDHEAKITGLIEGIGDSGILGTKCFTYTVKAF